MCSKRPVTTPSRQQSHSSWDKYQKKKKRLHRAWQELVLVDQVRQHCVSISATPQGLEYLRSASHATANHIQLFKTTCGIILSIHMRNYKWESVFGGELCAFLNLQKYFMGTPIHFIYKKKKNQGPIKQTWWDSPFSHMQQWIRKMRSEKEKLFWVMGQACLP